MKRYYLIMIIALTLLSSGCATMKQNTNEINRLKGQMVTVESALARQNLLVQQSQKETQALLDRNDELTMEIARLSRMQERTETVRAASKRTTSRKSTSSKSQVLSDKLGTKPAIRDVQMALRNAGFYRGEIDGKAGSQTRSSIKKFQQANNLTVDGIIGKKTWSKLKEYL